MGLFVFGYQVQANGLGLDPSRIRFEAKERGFSIVMRLLQNVWKDGLDLEWLL